MIISYHIYICTQMLIIIYIHIAVCTVFFLYSHSNTWFLAFKVNFHNMKPETSPRSNVGALGARAVSLVTSGVVPERRFAFFDQVHPWGSTYACRMGPPR